MNDLEQNFLAGKLLRILRDWIHNIIPEETKNCIRSKNAVITGTRPRFHSYEVMSIEDYDRYQKLKEQYDNKEISFDELNKEYEDLIFLAHPLYGDTVYHNIGDAVIIGYIDNKISNAFIICKNERPELDVE